MYLTHFGLKQLPFGLTPDLSFFVNSTPHQKALNVLLVALRSGEGFVKITGEVGTGKTLLCRKLLASLKGKACSAYIPNPLQTPHQLYSSIAREIGIKTAESDSIPAVLEQIHHALFHYAKKGQRVVLCIDEAQDMPDATLEAVRLLSNLETEKRKLVQIIFFAQPELNRRLAQNRLRQLQQRICFSYELSPLSRRTVNAYIDHRLRRAQSNAHQLFSPMALRTVAYFSRGVPRLVNILCHKALMATFGKGKKRVGALQVWAAVRDTDSVAVQRGWCKRLLPLTGLLLIVATTLSDLCHTGGRL